MMKRVKDELLNAGLKAGLQDRSRNRRNTARAAAEIQDRDRPPRNDLRPELKLEYRLISGLKLASRRVRRAARAHVAAVGRSIGWAGFCVPILISTDGRVIDGHIQIQAAEQLGMTEVPCIVIDHLTSEELRLLRLTVNRLAEKGEWDLDELKLEFKELIELEISIEDSGFEMTEIDQILLEDDDLSEDESDSLSVFYNSGPPVSRIGDSWRLGGHCVICGDARDPAVYDTLMGGSAARLIFTDPPYNVQIQGHVSGLGKTSHGEFAMASGELTNLEFRAFLVDFMACANRWLMDGGMAFECMDWGGLPILCAAAEEIGWTQLNLIVWVKSNAGMGSLYRSQHELIALFKKGTSPHLNNVQLGSLGRHRTNTWHYPGASSLGSDAREGLQVHPTVKPTAMIADALLDVTKRGDIVLDPFLGSGSTLIAAENTGRKCYGIEIDPRYVDVILKRWADHTGKEPILVESGRAFSEIAELRAGNRVRPHDVIDAQVPDATDSTSEARVTIIKAPNVTFRRSA